MNASGRPLGRSKVWPPMRAMGVVVLDVAPQDLFECELGRDYSLPVEWIREGEILPPSGSGDPDSLRAIRPWVLEQADGTLRMWYSGHDGTTWRILEAVQREGRGWDRVGLAIDAGFAGDSDGYGVQSPCAVRTPGGYLMCYAGFDGEVTRLHMATSSDGRDWAPQGTFMQRGSEDGLGASHPCLVVTGERWWLFFSGYDGSRNGRRAVVLAAVSSSGASWDRIGTVLEPAGGELATSHPCVVEISETFYMFYGSDDGQRVSIALATSTDGVSWERNGTTLAPSGEGPDALSVDAPCVLKLADGSLHMWYSGLSVGDTGLAYRVCSATFPGPQPILGRSCAISTEGNGGRDMPRRPAQGADRWFVCHFRSSE